MIRLEVKRLTSSLRKRRGERSAYVDIFDILKGVLEISRDLILPEPDFPNRSRPDIAVLRREGLENTYLVVEVKTDSLEDPADLQRVFDDKFKYFEVAPVVEYLVLCDLERFYVWRAGAPFETPEEVVLWENTSEVIRVIQSLHPKGTDYGAHNFRKTRDSAAGILRKSLKGRPDAHQELQVLLAAIHVSVFERKDRPSLGSALALSDWGVPAFRSLEEDPNVRQAFAECVEKRFPSRFEWYPCVQTLGLDVKKYEDLKQVLELETAAKRLQSGIVDPFCGNGAIFSFTLARYLTEEGRRGALLPKGSYGAVEELKAIFQRFNGSDPNIEAIILAKILLLQGAQDHVGDKFIQRDFLEILKERVVLAADPVYAKAATLATVLPDRPVSNSKNEINRRSGHQGMANESVVNLVKMGRESESIVHIVHHRKSLLGTAVASVLAREQLQPFVSGRTTGLGLNSLTTWWNKGQVSTDLPVILEMSGKQTPINRNQVFRTDTSLLPPKVFESFYKRPGSFCLPRIGWEPGPKVTETLRKQPTEGCYPQYGSGDSPLFGFSFASPLAYVPREYVDERRKGLSHSRGRQSSLYPRAKVQQYGILCEQDEYGFRYKGYGNLGVFEKGRVVAIDPLEMFVFARTRNPCLVITPHPQALVNNEYWIVKLKQPYPLHMLAQSRISQILFRLRSSLSKSYAYTWTNQSCAWIWEEEVLPIGAELMVFEHRFRQALDPLKLWVGNPTASIKDECFNLRFTGIEEQVRKVKSRVEGQLSFRTSSGREAAVYGPEASLDTVQISLSAESGPIQLGKLQVRKMPVGFKTYQDLEASCFQEIALIRSELDVVVADALGISDEDRKGMLSEEPYDERSYGLVPTGWAL